MPATGEPPAVTVAVADDEIASPPLWSQMKETCRAVYAGGKE